MSGVERVALSHATPLFLCDADKSC